MTLATMTTLRLSNCLLVSFCILSFTILRTALCSTPVECHVEGCGCQFTNKSGTYEITMKDIKQKFEVKDKGGEWTYYIDPCYDFTMPNCIDVTMCQSGSTYGNFPVARNNIKNFSSFVNEDTQVVVTYQNITYEKASRQMIINLKCGPLEGPDSVKEDTSKNPITYTLDITAPGACPTKVSPHNGGGGSSSSGPSTGTVIVIVFFVVLVVYLVAGILFMKYRRGATGKEVIPNVEFWSSLPGLIKDGCVFFGKKMKELCDRCCQREGYSEI